MKFVLFLSLFFASFSSFAWVAQSGSFYSSQQSVQERCSLCYNSFDYWGNFRGVVQDCQNAVWHSFYGTEYGYFCDGYGCSYRQMERTWYYFKWSDVYKVRCEY